MSQTINHSTSTSGGIGSSSARVPVTGEGYDQREVLLPPTTEDKQIDWDASAGLVLSFMATCAGLDDGVTITLKTNDPDTPDDELTFITPGSLHYAKHANGALLNGYDNPFTADISSLYASNPSTTQTGALRLEFQVDPTPA